MKLRRSRLLLSVYALFIAGSVATVFAVDGVVLIDQSRALAGNVTPGDAPGFPVSITQPGSYRLSGNLTAPSDTSGIVIQADHVTLDLNGFRVTGDGAGAGIGIGTADNNGFAVNHRGVTVKNGTVTKFLSGLILSDFSNGAASTEVREIRALDNRVVGIGVGENAIVTGSFAIGNVRGIVVGPNSTVTGNTAAQNTQDGFIITCPATVVGNTATGNQTSFSATNPFDCTFANNTPAP
jgi:hypothetical protein